jgi:two-component system phosphate regulon sensor histidine kinase PhoR
MMMNGIIKDEDIAGFAKSINKEAGRLINLVNDIILITELEGNDIYMQKEEINIVELVLSVAKRLEIPAKKRNVDIEVIAVQKDGERIEVCSLDGSDNKLPYISINAVYNMIEELVLNLSDNAIKYNKENGNVYIYVQDEEKNVKIIVEDTGIGIPNHDKVRVFQRFYRVDKSRSKEVGGTGLGLSIVKHVARYHGGKVYAEDRVGGGTRMVAKLPK